MIWVVELRKHFFFFAALWLVVAVAGTFAAIFREIDVFSTVQSFATILSWSAAVVYGAVVLLSYISLGNDLLLQIGTISRWRVVVVKAAVLFALAYVLHVVNLGFQLRIIFAAVSDAATSVLVYVLLAKAMSIASFLSLVIAAAVVAKLWRGKTMIVIVFSLLVVSAIVSQVILLWRIGAPNTSHFFVGAGGQFFTVNLYANVLPITLTTPSDGFLPQIWIDSVLLNFASLGICTVTWLLFAKFRRFNFLPL